MPVHDFIVLHPLAEDKLQLKFQVGIVDAGLKYNFLPYINHKVSGSFCGVEEGERMLKSVQERWDFNKEEDTLKFLDEVIDYLTHDKRLKTSPDMKVSDQLRKGVTVLDLYDYIFSLGYLAPRYIIKFDEKELHVLSPGEKGSLLLIFFLLVDKNNIPLIIDQPEENLDQQTVYNLLVDSIKDAKKARQIFIVTHNANLAVVCDSEQIVYAYR